MESENSQLEFQPRRGRKLLKAFAGLIIVSAVFALGVLVGRGNLAVSHLSYQPAYKAQLNYSGVDQVYSLLQKDFDGQLNTMDLINGAKSGLVQATGDPYTEFFNPKQAKEFNQQLSGTLTGIGAELGVDNGNIVIISPLAGYPAEKAGLKPKDIVAAIDQVTTSGMTVSQAVQKIRGPIGTNVTLSIIRGANKPFDVTITRTQISVPSVKSQVDGDIGYLKISQFEQDTYKLAQAAASSFKAQNVRGIVLDLRDDPGGYLDQAVAISSLWLDPGKTVVSERRGSTVLDTRQATGNNIFKGLPTAVLINSGSASASEITAGALHDSGVATLVGEKSFGKGSVQQIENLSDGSEVKITFARWYTPNGANIDKSGITPDSVVSMTDAQQQAGQDPQKDKAYEIVRAKIH